MTSGSTTRGLLMLAASVLLCAAAHLILRAAASGAADGVWELAVRPGVWLGLAVYGSGTVLWILCLRRLELVFAYPASAVQLLLVYAGAAALLGESIPPLRWFGAALILVGIALLFIEARRADA